MEIGAMNRRINFKSWGSTQDEGGGAIPTLLLSYTIWAKVEPRNGQPYTGEQQQVWNYDYKITFRYEKSRVVKSNYTIDYDSKRLSINSISFENEGNRKYAVARCRTTDVNIDSGNDILAIISTYDYYGIAHENYFVSDSSPDLRGKTIIGAFKDGIEFAVLLGGTPNPLAKEVVYNSAIGSFIWSHSFEPGEHALIQYVDIASFTGNIFTKTLSGFTDTIYQSEHGLNVVRGLRVCKPTGELVEVTETYTGTTVIIESNVLLDNYILTIY